jgi:hypothetical protein
LEISRLYSSLAVKIICNNEDFGSGCLFKPQSEEFCYVFTAKHCIEKAINQDASVDCKKINIEYFSEELEFQEIKAIDCFIHSNSDIALIKVKYIDTLADIAISKLNYRDEVVVYGFPKRLDSDNTPPSQLIRCEVGLDYTNCFEITSMNPLYTFNKGAHFNIGGLSGSGIFTERDNSLQIIGILIELKTSDGAYNGMVGIDISKFNEILSDSNLPLLIPGSLHHFKNFLIQAFNEHEDIIKMTLMDNAKNVLHITPMDIIESFGDKLFLPYAKNNMLKEELWEGWLYLLTYIFMEIGAVKDLDSALIRKKGDIEQKIKFYFANSNYNRLQDVIKHLFTKIYDDLSKNDCVIINNNGKVARTSYTNMQIQSILRSIFISDPFDTRFMIDQEDFCKNVSCIHLSMFSQKIAEFDYSSIDYFKNPFEFKSKLSDCIAEVFYEVTKIR